MHTSIALVAALFLAFANGANDNFKGVATLYGSGTTSYRKALIWASITTLLGSIAAIYISQGLIKSFSGKGLVPDEVLLLPAFGLAVGFGAASTVLLATRLGFPISTTHAITGALTGAGLGAAGSLVNVSQLGKVFFIPLLISPLVAMVLAAILYPLFKLLRKRLGLKKESCVCIEGKMVPSSSLGAVSVRGLKRDTRIESIELPTVVASNDGCQSLYRGKVLGVSAQAVLDSAHFLSAGVVCFARGMNDAPKIAALLILTASLPLNTALLIIGLSMVVGGALQARRVADTMSLKVTGMNHGQGFTANLITGLMVLYASKLGVPVSTTHVSCGTLFGIGAATKRGHWKTILEILTSWVITLPVAAALAAAFFFLANSFM